MIDSRLDSCAVWIEDNFINVKEVYPDLLVDKKRDCPMNLEAGIAASLSNLKESFLEQKKEKKPEGLNLRAITEKSKL